MEGEEIYIEINDDIFCINDPLCYKKFKCEFRELFDNYYGGEQPFSIFKRMLKLSVNQTKKEIYFTINHKDDKYILDFVCPGIIDIEINFVISNNDFIQDKDTLYAAIKNAQGAQAIVEYIDDALSKINSKEIEFVITDDDFSIDDQKERTFETFGLEKFKELFKKHDLQGQLSDIYDDRVENIYTRAIHSNLGGNIQKIKDMKFIEIICKSDKRICCGIKDKEMYYSINICDTPAFDYTPKIINAGDRIKLKGLITFNRNQYCEELYKNNPNSGFIYGLKLLPKLIRAHKICKLPFTFKNVESTSRFIRLHINVNNGLINKNTAYYTNNINGFLEYKLFTTDNYLYLKVIGYVCGVNNYYLSGNRWTPQPYTCRITNLSKLFERHSLAERNDSSCYRDSSGCKPYKLGIYGNSSIDLNSFQKYNGAVCWYTKDGLNFSNNILFILEGIELN